MTPAELQWAHLVTEALLSVRDLSMDTRAKLAGLYAEMTLDYPTTLAMCPELVTTVSVAPWPAEPEVHAQYAQEPPYTPSQVLENLREAQRQLAGIEGGTENNGVNWVRDIIASILNRGIGPQLSEPEVHVQHGTFVKVPESETPCRHEWYQGKCVHCEMKAADYRIQYEELVRKSKWDAEQYLKDHIVLNGGILGEPPL